MEQSNALVVQAKDEALVKSGEVKAMVQQYNILVELAKSVMLKDRDFGIIPGVAKPSLLKPGAEKLRLTFGLETRTELVREMFDIDKPYLDFTYKSSVYNKFGVIMAECEGNANSYEPKFRYLWVREEDLPKGVNKQFCTVKKSTEFQFKFSLSKRETSGKYGKPENYWKKFDDAIKDGTAKAVKKSTSRGMQDGWEIESVVYRIENPDIVGLKNTLMKMAQKRSFVGAIMLSTGASEFFTQDVEDMEFNTDYTDDKVEKFEKETGINLHDDKTALAEDKPAEKEKPKGKKKEKEADTIYQQISKSYTMEDLNALWKDEYMNDNPLIDAFKEQKRIIRQSIYESYVGKVVESMHSETLDALEKEIRDNKHITDAQKADLSEKIRKQKNAGK